MLVQRSRMNHNDLETIGGTVNGIAVDTIRFNSAPGTGQHSRSMALRATLSHRSKTCHCECHLTDSVGDSTLEPNDDPELVKVESGLNEGS